AGIGSANRGGAADRGAGPGAGGIGSGTGGGNGSGAGGGNGDDNGNAAALPRQISGKLHYWEIPKELRRARAGGVIRLRYRIGTDGRVSGCTVLLSSGFPDFDRETCARITERFRFRPALDAQGRAVPYVMTEIHGWDDTED
ncbi:MAG TPA: energy transducer TonB, partial [Novosphingobium sp.]|nr:energy transducer TonB [Novosphingobium sp.]